MIELLVTYRNEGTTFLSQGSNPRPNGRLLLNLHWQRLLSTSTPLVIKEEIKHWTHSHILYLLHAHTLAHESHAQCVLTHTCTYTDLTHTNTTLTYSLTTQTCSQTQKCTDTHVNVCSVSRVLYSSANSSTAHKTLPSSASSVEQWWERWTHNHRVAGLKRGGHNFVEPLGKELNLNCLGKYHNCIKG